MTRLHAIAAVFVAFCCVTRGAGAYAQTERLVYDPDRCPTEAHGKVYLRLATGIAFGFPASSLQFLYGTFDPKPEAPDPSAPEGCPGNPIVTHWATVGYSFEVQSETDGGEPRRIVTYVKLSGADTLAFDPHTGMLHLQSSVFHLSEVSRKLGRCEEAPEGWDACYWPKRGPHDTENGAFYIALPNQHPLRSGFPLAVGCCPPMPWNGARLCHLDYRPLRRVYLAVNFTDQEIPIEHLFDFDDAAVAWLERSRVPELDFTPPPGVLWAGEGQ